MRIDIFILLLFILVSCNEQKPTKTERVKIDYFDSIQQYNIQLLDSLNLTKFNDTAKWLMYTIQCNDSSSFGRTRERKILAKIPLAFLKLNLSYMRTEGDTLSLLYNFLVDDSIRVEQTTAKKSIVDGIMFNTKADTLIGYVIGEAIFSQTGNPHSRYENPLQPEVIVFIKNNKDKLNPWFREEAKRRKIIE